VTIIKDIMTKAAAIGAAALALSMIMPSVAKAHDKTIRLGQVMTEAAGGQWQLAACSFRRAR
jgi:hypothetical protein